MGRSRCPGPQGREGRLVVFYKEIEVAAEADDSETKTRLFARATPVFATEQVDGYQPPAIDTSPVVAMTPIERAQAFVAATGARIDHGGTRAFYRPSTDSIQLPKLLAGGSNPLGGAITKSMT
jgi:antirestriction protein ArdC